MTEKLVLTDEKKRGRLKMVNLKVATFNIRYDFDTHDGINCFIHRAGSILLKIDAEKPDVICFQEVSDQIRAFLEKYLVDYIVVGHGRNADRKGEGVSIAYRKDCMSLMALETFWLSPTPYTPASRFENQSPCPRTCPVALLKHKDMKQPVLVYGVHLDHMNDKARVVGMQMILDKISENKKRYGDLPIFVLGDYNAFPDSGAIELCETFEDVPMEDAAKEVVVTFHGYGHYAEIENPPVDENGMVGVKIDYIYVDKKTANNRTAVKVWDDVKHGIYLSDHYPICCEFAFPSL